MSEEDPLIENAEFEDWLDAAASTFVFFVRDQRRLLDITKSRLHEIQHLTRFVDVMSKSVSPDVRAKYSSLEVRRQAEDTVTFISTFVRSDFSSLHLQSVVLAWAALETLVSDVCLGALVETKFRILPQSQIRVSLCEFSVADLPSQAALAIREIERSQGSVLKAGVSRFSQLFQSVGLSVPPTRDELRRSIFLSQQIRNLAAHRRGRIDAQFYSHFTEFGQIGDVIELRSPEYHRLIDGIFEYGLDLVEAVNSQLFPAPNALVDDGVGDPA